MSDITALQACEQDLIVARQEVTKQHTLMQELKIEMYENISTLNKALHTRTKALEQSYDIRYLAQRDAKEAKQVIAKLEASVQGLTQATVKAERALQVQTAVAAQTLEKTRQQIGKLSIQHNTEKSRKEVLEKLVKTLQEKAQGRWGGEGRLET